MTRSRAAVPLRAAGGRGRQRPVRLGARRELALLIGVSVLVMLLVGLGGVLVSRAVVHGQALEDAERITERLATLVVEPLLLDYLAGGAGVGEELPRAVRNRMADGDLTDVTVWSEQGQVLFSDRPEDVGRLVDPPPADLDEALAGRTTSAFEDEAPESDAPGDRSVDAPGRTRYVEVYTPLDVPARPGLVLEAYYDYDRVDMLADRLLRQTLPLVLVPLLILQLIQIPVAVSLTRRLRRHEQERSRLLERAISVSDRERVRFAADLHDGPIQDLSGISYALGAVAPTVAARHTSLMSRIQDALHRSIASLRGLMTDLYPPDLRSGNLDQAIAALADQLRTEDCTVVLELEALPPVSEEVVSTLYRVVREALANVQKHAQAGVVRVSLGPVAAAPGAEPRVRLVVADDGVGVEPSQLDRRAEGHLGLRLLTDRVESLGGRLVITSAVGHGTTVAAELPAAAETGL